MEKLIDTAWGVAVAIGASALIFVGVNKWFDLARRYWTVFAAISGAVISAMVAGVLAGNRLSIWRFATEEPLETPSAWWYVLLAAAVAAMVAAVQSRMAEGPLRVVSGLVGGALVGGLHGFFLSDAAYPAMRIVPLLAWPIGGAMVGYAWGRLAGKGPLRRAVDLATVGWVVGALGIPSIGGGTRVEAITALAVLGLGIAARFVVSPPANEFSKEAVATGSRVPIFLGPALLFISASLIIPTLRTIYLSFLDPKSVEFVGLRNYVLIFTDPGIFNLSGWPELFTNRFFLVGVGLAGVGVLAAVISGRTTGHGVAFSPASGGALAAGIFAIFFGLFAVLRGTIFNNLWWVLSVVVLSTALGLAVAVLADRSRSESIAKSLIFMPMAISFVGAGIIWRFMYIARPAQKPQTGVMNTPWVWLGKISTEGGPGRTALAIALVLFMAFTLYLAYRGLAAGENGLALGGMLSAVIPAWLLYRIYDGTGIGGVEVLEDGTFLASPHFFLTDGPYNNFWIMLVLIWIQTGFAMVIFSAAIKAVPAELIEASRVDGASESQTFWQVVIPQISTTIGVVVTTLVVLVMKVFDIVKVMTNGNFDTQVLANEMWQRAFTELNFGLGSAVAIVLFVSVLPVMYINIRRMQKEAM
jgi:alpha-glucoside transport system permease protein